MHVADREHASFLANREVHARTFPVQMVVEVAAVASGDIRLSDKDSCVRPRDVEIRQTKLDEAKLLMQVFVRVV